MECVQNSITHANPQSCTDLVAYQIPQYAEIPGSRIRVNTFNSGQTVREWLFNSAGSRIVVMKESSNQLTLEVLAVGGSVVGPVATVALVHTVQNAGRTDANREMRVIRNTSTVVVPVTFVVPPAVATFCLLDTLSFAYSSQYGGAALSTNVWYRGAANDGSYAIVQHDSQPNLVNAVSTNVVHSAPPTIMGLPTAYLSGRPTSAGSITAFVSCGDRTIVTGGYLGDVTRFELDSSGQLQATTIPAAFSSAPPTAPQRFEMLDEFGGYEGIGTTLGLDDGCVVTVTRGSQAFFLVMLDTRTMTYLSMSAPPLNASFPAPLPFMGHPVYLF